MLIHAPLKLSFNNIYCCFRFVLQTIFGICLSTKHCVILIVLSKCDKILILELFIINVDTFCKIVKSTKPRKEKGIKLEKYADSVMDFAPLEKIIRLSTDEQLVAMTLGTTLRVKIAIYKEFSYRNFGYYNSMSDTEILELCLSDSQLERSLVLKIAYLRDIV